VARPSPQTDRVVALVDLLTAHPGHAFTLAEVTRRTGVNKSTAHSMLTALTAARWLVRDPVRKTYRLGPALVGVGRAASEGFPALELARPALVALSRDAGVHALALAVADDHVTVADHVRDVRAGFMPPPAGDIPLRPPFGAVAVAWGPAELTERWLGLAPPGTRYREALAAVRSRGYAVELSVASDARLRELLAHLGDDAPLAQVVERLAGEAARGVEVLPAALEAGRTYAVSAVNAPVFDHDGRAVLVLALVGFTEPVRGDVVEALGARVARAADAVTGAIHGRRPATVR
jgi:DNA-binding IclR family transcriptional regulator